MALQRLIRTLYQLIKQLTRTKQHFLENLTYKYSTLAREMRDESTSLFSATLISLMTEDFTLDELAELPLEASCDLLQKKGRGRFKQPEKIVTAIQRAIRASYRLGAVVQESIDIVLGVLVCEMRTLEKNLQELDKAIKKLVVILPEYQCLTSIPGVDKV